MWLTGWLSATPAGQMDPEKRRRRSNFGPDAALGFCSKLRPTEIETLAGRDGVGVATFTQQHFGLLIKMTISFVRLISKRGSAKILSYL